MRAELVSRGRTVKTVLVTEVGVGDSEEAVIDAAVAAAGETRTSLFGWKVERSTSQTRAMVSLYTD